MGIVSKIGKRVAKAASKQTPGQKKIAPATKGQRAYARGQIKGIATGAAGMAGLAGLGLAELNKRMKNAESEAERAKLQAAIEKEIRRIAQEDAKAEGTTSKVSQSPRPKMRPEGFAKGGMPKKYAGGGYANCGASMKPTQKSSMKK